MPTERLIQESLKKQNSEAQPRPCPLCRGRSLRELYPESSAEPWATEDYLITKCELRRPRILVCQSCQHIYADNSIEPTAYYQELVDQDYERDQKYRRKELFQAFGRVRTHISFKGEWPDILDVGCATGCFLEEYLFQSRKEALAQGVEPSAWAVKICRQKGLSVWAGGFENLGIPSNSFDVVTMFDVLSLMKDPPEVLKVSHDIIRSSGYLVLTMPNINSRFAKVFGGKWWFLERAQQHFFSQAVLTELLRQNGFEVKLTLRHYKSINVNYFLNLLPLISPYLRGLSQVQLKGFLGRLAVPLYAGQMLCLAERV